MLRSASCFPPDILIEQADTAFEIWQVLHQRVDLGQPVANIHNGDHPTTRMWVDYRNQLRDYAMVLAVEAVERAKMHRDYLNQFATLQNINLPQHEHNTPWWWGLDTLHSSHRASLVARNPGWFRAFNWKETAKTPIFWPVGPNLTPMPF